jgi:uncharacterized protein
MLLSKENSNVNVIAAWKQGAIRVGEEWLLGHVIISPEAIIRDWGVDSPGALAVEDLEPAIAMRPEIILVGTGGRLVLPELNLMQLLGERGIGVEIMDTPAACRTYNVLAHEYRRVVAALFEPID